MRQHERVTKNVQDMENRICDNSGTVRNQQYRIISKNLSLSSSFLLIPS